MVAAFRVAVRLGWLDAAQLERLTRLLSDLGLPTNVDPYLRPEVLAFIAADKKRRADKLTFVLPGRPGDVRLHTLALAELERLLQ